MKEEWREEISGALAAEHQREYMEPARKGRADRHAVWLAFLILILLFVGTD
ncbi:MAG: hypothetical protein H5U03_09835 [Clostridia bacterium]|nr:hypothetical protein [Clostridia bacterium]